jgi:hypothetical protein
MPKNAQNIIAGSADICIDGVDIGLTTGGVNVRFERTFVETEADQILGIAKRFLNMERVFVDATLLEVTLENMRIALGYPSDNLTGGTKLLLGYNSSCSLAEHEMVLRGPAPGCGCRTFVLPRVVSVSSPEYNMQRTQEIQFQVSFEVLKDDEAGPFEGFFGAIYDGCAFQESQTCA